MIWPFIKHNSNVAKETHCIRDPEGDIIVPYWWIEKYGHNYKPLGCYQWGDEWRHFYRLEE